MEQKTRTQKVATISVYEPLGHVIEKTVEFPIEDTAWDHVHGKLLEQYPQYAGRRMQGSYTTRQLNEGTV